ncbi:MAG: hypothetical protein CM15mP58_10060 [Burkholderiaceae bacterium]|nr:MAG: hypothetical protein CM15mP58_10060 [Burkholderiaceae bacterium]
MPWNFKGFVNLPNFSFDLRLTIVNDGMGCNSEDRTYLKHYLQFVNNPIYISRTLADKKAKIR